MSILPTVLAIFPLAIFFVLLFWRKLKLIWVCLASFLIVMFLSLFYWRIYPVYLIASLEKGFFVALDILFIIFGAIFFLKVMNEAKVIKNAGIYLESISKDLRIQVILLAWFFENFLEGTAGFGTPSTVVAPLLVGLGINPINAVIIALSGNSTSVVFGAAGAPIKIGFGELAGATLPLKASLFNLVGVLVPVFMLGFLVKGKIQAKKEFWEMFPFALWSGFAFILPSIASTLLGVEFPSILGSIAGLLLVLTTIKLGIFIPKTEKEMIENTPAPTLPIFKVIFPYMILVTLLIVGKFAIGDKGIAIPLLVKHNFAFFNPGFAFIISGLISAVYFKVSVKNVFGSLKSSFASSLSPFLVIVFMSALAQIMVNSSQNTSGLSSMVSCLAVNFKNVLLPFWAPVAGAFGSFLTGSATVSNLMFGNFLATTATELKFNIDTILALTVVGGAAGNMVALADMLTAETIVGVKHEERKILKEIIFPCLIYVTIVGVMGLLVLKVI